MCRNTVKYTYRAIRFDKETELYYLSTRYYSPNLGRFINADGLVSTGQGLLGNNMFAYCLNNPVVMIDQSGTYAATIEEISSIVPIVIGIAALLDAATPFLEIAAILGGAVAGVVVVGNLIADASEERNKEKVEAITETIAIDPEPQAIYYGVNLYGGSFNIITAPMTFDEAVLWAQITALSNQYSNRAAWGLWTEKEEDAISMTIALCSINMYGVPVHDKPRRGHLGHFHTVNRCIGNTCAHSFHVWYGRL